MATIKNSNWFPVGQRQGPAPTIVPPRSFLPFSNDLMECRRLLHMVNYVSGTAVVVLIIFFHVLGLVMASACASCAWATYRVYLVQASLG